MSLLGFQFWPNISGAGEAVEFVRRRRPALVKVLDPHADTAVCRALRAASEDTVIVWRLVGFFDDRTDALGGPPERAEEAARRHWEELKGFLVDHKNLFDIFELFNEPGDANLDALVRYTNAFAALAAESGIRVASYAFSTGTPREGAWATLKALPAGPVVFAPHEYAWENQPQWGWHMLRFQRWLPDGALFYIGETGQEPGGIARWGEGDFKRLMAEYDDRLKASPNCLGAAIFCWNGQPIGWGDYAIWPRLAAWLDEYLARNPPIHRRALLLRRPDPPSPSPSPAPAPATLIVRAVDLSEFTGELDAETMEALGKHQIRGAVIGVVHGLGGGRWGLNRWAFAQAEALERAGIRILGAYVWPPEAVRWGWVRNALKAILRRGDQVVFLDVESGRWRAADLAAYARILRDAGFRAGIYSGPGAWISSVRLDSVADSRALRELADLPYWEANYPRKFRDYLGRWNGTWPTEADHPWAPVTQGPWKFSPLWQFVGTTRVGSRVFDLNVAHAMWWGLGQS